MIPTRRTKVVAIGCMWILCLIGCVRRSANRSALNKQLLAASEKGDLVSASRLIREGADVNARSRDGSTSLMFAAERGNTGLVKLLLSHGANTQLKDRGGETALSRSLRVGNPQIASFLLGPKPSQALLNQTLFNTIENQPNVALLLLKADEIPPDPLIVLLLEKGADSNARDTDGSTPLEEAAGLGQLSIVKALVAKGANLEAKDNSGSTPLLAAACDCAEATMPDTDVVVEFLLKQGANINARDNDGDTALMIARHDQVADVAQLLEAALAKSR